MDKYRITRLVSIKRVPNFKFRLDKENNKLLWPGTLVWKATIKNFAGAIVGAPPVTYPEWWSSETYIKKKLENDFDEWMK